MSVINALIYIFILCCTRFLNWMVQLTRHFFLVSIHFFLYIFFTLTLIDDVVARMFCFTFSWIKRFFEFYTFVIKKVMPMRNNKTGTILLLNTHSHDIDFMHYRYYITASHQFFPRYNINICVSDFSFVLMPVAIVEYTFGHQCN